MADARRPMRSRRRVGLFDLVAVAATVALVALICYPILGMIGRELFSGGAFDLGAVVFVLTDEDFHEAALNTAIVIAVAGALAIVVGGTFGWLNEKTDASLGVVTALLPLVPLVLPPIALSVGWVFLADSRAGVLNVAIRGVMGFFGEPGKEGPLNVMSWPGVIFAYSLYFVPFAFLMISAAFRNIDPVLEEASRTSGASTWQTFRRISFPAIVPSVAGAALLLVILGIAQFSFVRILGVPAGIEVLSEYMVRKIQSYPSHIDHAVVVGLLVLCVVATAWVVQRRITAGRDYAVVSGKSGSTSPIRLGPWRHVMRAIMLGYLALTSVLPFLALVLVGLQPYWTPAIRLQNLTWANFAEFLGTASIARTALVTSVTLGVAGATIGICLAAVLATYGRMRGGRSRSIVDGVMKLPGAFSHIVMGVAFLIALGGAPFFLNGTLGILLLAYVLINMPQASIAASSSLDQIGQELLDASAVSGAGPGRTFRSVVLPLMRSGLTAGWALLFVVMVGDLTASAILAGTRNPVVGFVFLDIYDNGTFSQLAALGTMVSLVTGTIVALVVRLARPRFGAVTGG